MKFRGEFVFRVRGRFPGAGFRGDMRFGTMRGVLLSRRRKGLSMTPRDTTLSNAFGTVARIVEEIAYLPAVATQDWCDRVARTLFAVRPGSLVCVTLAQVDDAGQVVQMECDGLADGAKPASTLDPDLLRFEAQPAFGWSARQLAKGTVWAEVMSRTQAESAFRSSRAGRKWADQGVTDLLLGVMSMPASTNDRMLIAEIGVRGGEALGDADVEILRAVLPSIANRAMRAFGREVSNPNNRVTPKEQVILEHLAHGETVKQIATSLGRSPHTVHDHVKSLHRKLNATSRGELVARMLGHIDDGQLGATIKVARVKPGGVKQAAGRG